MSTAVEATGFVMCIVSWLITGSALANDYWKMSTVSGSVIISQRQFENLWHSCAENSAGIAECRDFESLLALPGKTGTPRVKMPPSCEREASSDGSRAFVFERRGQSLRSWSRWRKPAFSLTKAGCWVKLLTDLMVIISKHKGLVQRSLDLRWKRFPPETE